MIRRNRGDDKILILFFKIKDSVCNEELDLVCRFYSLLLKDFFYVATKIDPLPTIKILRISLIFDVEAEAESGGVHRSSRCKPLCHPALVKFKDIQF